MPELPELEVVAEVLNRRVTGQTIARVDVIPPGGGIVTRDLTFTDFASTLTGSTIGSTHRRGKFLVLSLSGELRLVINEKLTGRLQLCPAGEKPKPKTHVVFGLADGTELRYFDQKTMGQIYLTRDLTRIPGLAALGPEPYEVTAVEFAARLKPYRGEIKTVLINGECIAGIGNAYADEILWAAHIHPYRKRSQLTADETTRLHAAMQSVLREATARVRAEMGDAIHLKPRDFMAIHMKAGQPCPRCNSRISAVGANQRVTNYCLNCQPGGLIKGM